MSISDDGLLYVPLFDRPYVVVVDTKIPAIVGRIDGHWGMHGTRLSADGRRLYAGSILTQSMLVLDVKANVPLSVYGFREGVRPFAITRDESLLYAQLSRLHGFVKVDLQSGKIMETIALPGLPDDFRQPEEFPFNVNHGLELSPDEAYIVAAGSVVNTVSIFRHPSLELLATLPVCSDPNWVVFSGGGNYAYVACRESNDVSVISMDELREIKRVKTGGQGAARMRVVDVPIRAAGQGS
jgi:DNA-binding beta-propeller fold protein YncE